MVSIWPPLLPSLVPDGLNKVLQEALGKALLAIAKARGSLSVSHGQSSEQLQMPAARALDTEELSRYTVRTVPGTAPRDEDIPSLLCVSDPMLLKNKALCKRCYI